jgi:lipid-binding SYLF domain-containing protein
MALGCSFAAFAPSLGCATAPKTTSEQGGLEARANATIDEMSAHDPDLRGALSSAAGYAVFPDIGKAGAGVGGAFGRGVLYQNGRPSGFVKVEQGSVGAQLGAQTFAEVLILSDAPTVERLKRGELAAGADAGAVALTAGALAHAQLGNGVRAVVMPRGGLMAELTLSGQRIKYEPRG